MKVYMVKHYFTVDGGCGDAIANEKTVACFGNEADANAFVEEYSIPHVYSTPYEELKCGLLRINEIDVLSYDDAIKKGYKWTDGAGCGPDSLLTEEERLYWLMDRIKASSLRLIRCEYQEDISDFAEELSLECGCDQDFVKDLLMKEREKLKK